jgi:hypothetical protein
VFVENTGKLPVWVGGSAVTTVAGTELAPGGSVTLTNAVQPLFAVAGFTPGTAGTGTATAAVAQGGSVITVASGGTAFTVGSDIAVEQDTPRQEIATVSASAAGSVTTSAPFEFAHGSASTFSQVVPAPALIAVQAGAV